MKNKNTVIGLLNLSILFLFIQNCFAILAPPTPVMLHQTTGYSFKAYIFGDERYRRIETLDGFTIIHDMQTDNWYYAQERGNGEIVSSGIEVGRQNSDYLILKKHIMLSSEKMTQIISNRLKEPLKPIVREQYSKKLNTIANNLLTGPIKGTGKPLVILANFPVGIHESKKYKKSDFETLLFSDNKYPSGSMNDYFQEVSYGLFSVAGTIIDWTLLSKSYSNYCDGESGMGEWPKNSQGLVYDLVRKIDNFVNFAQYDQDHDGKVDCITIVFEGTADGSDNEFWPHAWALNSNAIKLDGVWINRFNIVNEQTDDYQLNPIGTFCHEYTHILGAPDLYDYDEGSYKKWDNNNHPVMFWCLMASGCYGCSVDGVQGACPAHLCAFIKYKYMGWITPLEINNEGTYQIKEIELYNDEKTVYKIPILNRFDEYFLIENRNPQSNSLFDKRDAWNETLDAGIIIMHIDEILPWSNSQYFNDGQPDDPWYRVWVEDPGQSSNLQVKPYLTKIDAAYSKEDAQDSFTPASTPYNTDSNDGKKSDIYITQISHSGSLMTFHLGQPTQNLTIIEPNGGEILKAGKKFDIIWKSEKPSYNIEIQYSSDHGINWSMIVENSVNSGNFSWSVPNISSSNCLIKIIDHENKLTDQSDSVFTIQKNDTPNWTSSIHIHFKQGTKTLEFGGHYNATTGFDQNLDIPTPPPAMIDYAYFKIPFFPYFLEKDIRKWEFNQNDNTIWNLRVFLLNPEIVTIKWDLQQFPNSGNLIINNMIDLSYNMRVEDSITISHTDSFQICYNSTSQFEFNFDQAGIYQISMPVYTDNNLVSQLFPSASAFIYDSNANKYIKADTLEPKRGYWLKIPSPMSAQIEGIPLHEYSQTFNVGWHLIGALVNPINLNQLKVKPDGAILSVYYWNNKNNSYDIIYPDGGNRIEPTKGYWFAIKQPCEITFSSNNFSTDIQKKQPLSSFARFQLTPPLPPQIGVNEFKIASPDESKILFDGNFPNPFNAVTQIKYQLNETGEVIIYIYNINGKIIRKLLEESQNPGFYLVQWDGRDDENTVVSSGVYFLKIFNQQTHITHKVIYLK